MSQQDRWKAQKTPAAGPVAGVVEFAQQNQTRISRGREPYQVFCLPCHDSAGDGQGLVVQRGFPRPPSFLDSRVRHLSDKTLFQYISSGVGVMAGYKAFISDDDRWAIVKYIRELQQNHRDRGRK